MCGFGEFYTENAKLSLKTSHPLSDYWTTLPSTLTADASGVIHQFDNEGYKEVWKFEAHQYAATSMRYHASKIATGGTDGKVRV